MTIPAAVAVCALLLALGVFQLLLAAGAPLGQFAWGGADRVLPQRLRIGSVAATVLYAAFATVVLDRAHLVSVLPDQLKAVGIWVIAGAFLLGAIPNLVSKSQPERYLMAPVTVLLSLLCLVIGLGW